MNARSTKLEGMQCNAMQIQKTTTTSMIRFDSIRFGFLSCTSLVEYDTVAFREYKTKQNKTKQNNQCGTSNKKHIITYILY